VAGEAVEAGAMVVCVASAIPAAGRLAVPRECAAGMMWRFRGGNLHHVAACVREARVHACVVSRAPPRRPRRRRAALGLAADSAVPTVSQS
jgi:hypothetical protein